jgi:hypothetical protein
VPELLTCGSMLACNMGAAPAPLVVPPLPGKPLVDGMPVASILDMIPLSNIPTFGMCKSMLNPEVQLATIAAQGTLTPMPCVPLTVAPWVPGSMAASADALQLATKASICACAWGGEISVEVPEQFTTTVDL